MVRVLPPWFENIGKRQVKSPKVYIRDSGILHGLLGLETLAEVQSYPKLGASWEGFVIEQIVRLLDTRDAYFWATHAGAKLDLLVLVRGKRYGFEIKYADAPAPPAPCTSPCKTSASSTCGSSTPAGRMLAGQAAYRLAGRCAAPACGCAALNQTADRNRRSTEFLMNGCARLRGVLQPRSPSGTLISLTMKTFSCMIAV